MNLTALLGVIGHVDHGKTALVRALTGIETDRLAEEKARGLSIVLGFSWLRTEHGIADLIDAPGHEDFIRAMISGATGIDGVVLCIAANEGIKPQTIEHLNIAQLLAVSRGLVVLTKCDLISEPALADARAEVRDLVRGTALHDAPIAACSAQTGEGLDELLTLIDGVVVSATPAPVHTQFFMPLDRVFTVQGFGVVVTGTLRWGPIRVGDRVTVSTSQAAATVRGLQIRGRAVELADAGQRVAVNLRGIDTQQLARGDVLASVDFVRPTRRVDAQLRLLPQATLRNGAAVQLLTGTTAVTARARVLGAAAVEGGETAFVQWRLDRPIATHPSEAYVIRSLSPRATLGGGRFIDVHPDRHRRFDTTVHATLRKALAGNAEEIVEQALVSAGPAGVVLSSLSDRSGVGANVLQVALTNAGAVQIDEDHYASAAVVQDVRARLIRAIDAFHDSRPREIGAPIRFFRDALSPSVAEILVAHGLRALVESGELEQVQSSYRRHDFDPFAALNHQERGAVGQLEQAFLESGLVGLSLEKRVQGDLLRESMFRLLLASGRLVRLRTYDRATRVVLHRDVVAGATAAIQARYPYPEAFPVKDVRDLLASTRRYVVPLLEHLDAIGLTERSGDLRRIRSG